MFKKPFITRVFTTVCALLCIFGSYSVFAEENPIEGKLQEFADHYLKKYQTQEHISGVALSVSTDNASPPITIYSGSASFVEHQPLKNFNLFQIGSITKSFIATILLQLEADPKYHFSLDDPLKKFLPQYPKWGNITVRELLNMTSRIPNYTETNQFADEMSKHPMKHWQAKELIEFAYSEPMKEKSFYYSNTNYILAGMIISRLTHHSVATEINKRLLSKDNSSHIHLKNTYYIPNHYPYGITDRVARGYYFKENGIYPLETDTADYSLSWGSSAGANVSNTRDMIKWVKVLFHSTDVLPSEQRKELLSMVSTKTGLPISMVSAEDPDGFGLGMGLSFDPLHPQDPIYNYEGSTLGYRAIFIYIPTQDIIISIIVNSAVAENNDHLTELLGNVYGYLTAAKQKNLL